MYKFFGEPLKEIKSKTSGKTVFRFDTKGEFITDDEEIIKRALGYFDYIKMEATETGEKGKKTVEAETITVTVKTEEKKEPATTGEKTKTKKCKKCDFTCDTQGELIKHYKENHPKEV